VSKLRARGFQDDLRSLIDEFLNASVDTTSGSTAREAIPSMFSMNRLARQMNERIGELLPQLF
jgi:hypothetical protein